MHRSIAGIGADVVLLVEAGRPLQGPPEGRTLRISATTITNDRDCLQRLRGWVRAMLARTPHAFNLDAVVIVVDELATNALLHSSSGRRNGAFGVIVSWNDSTIQVAVQDQGGPGEPRLGDPEPSSEAGRGLLLVASLTTSWGWTSNSFGALVWAQFSVNGSAEHRPSDSAAP